MVPYMGNVLEAVTIPAHQQITWIKTTMLKAGAYFSMMSGSGPTVFAFTEDKETAEKVVAALKDFNVETAITTTVGRKKT
jgi:4-diphosphocytidyl-2-C-methyl-D-erythritol kinase